MSISTERSDHGLTVEQTIAQTKAIHPDWEEYDIVLYLLNDAFFSIGVVQQAFDLTQPEADAYAKESIFT